MLLPYKNLPCLLLILSTLLYLSDSNHQAVASNNDLSDTSSSLNFSLNDTGVRFCTDINTTCPDAAFPNQDGDIGRDVIFNEDDDGYTGFDFSKVDNQGLVLSQDAAHWDCVLDNTTGLLWETKTNEGLRKESHRYIWYNPDHSTNGGYIGGSYGGRLGDGKCSGLNHCTTKHYIDELNRIQLCGYQDWRLPTVQELQGIVSYQPVKQQYQPHFLRFFVNKTVALDLRYFPKGMSCGEQNEGYITSSLVLPINPSLPTAHSISFVSGTEGISALPVLTPSANQCLRLVRGGIQANSSTGPQAQVPGQSCVTNMTPSTPTHQYTNNQDGTITDNQTGLTWMQCRLGQYWDQDMQRCTNQPNYYHSWQDALIAAEQWEFAGRSQWRLPNIKELYSIVENSCISPAINTELFSSWHVREDDDSYTWSATPYHNQINTVFYINFTNGKLGLQNTNSNSNFAVILVHDNSVTLE